ncbi:FAD/NAD(P)-binding protein [Georgenia sp. 10Sc9-8]|uniref:FAD/NAD(P)-binding protein n=1 Tax=Georgenia halotolerans TaxID=3028317 RepID=A0ABT5TXD9_9MICO|nr:FAD/NAD(P)-binding protein [Georgenia halotolerans]
MSAGRPHGGDVDLSGDVEVGAAVEIDVDVVVVGGGPRAVAVVERLTARHDGGPPVRVAVVDPVEVGAGATWRTDQHPLLLNNTYSAHTTIYPDASTPMDGPVTPGPDLVQWAAAPAPGAPGGPGAPGAPPRPPWVAAEVAAVEPWSYPTRRLQGVYYREQLAVILARGGVELTAVTGTAVDVRGDGDRRVVELADGRHLAGRVVVLAQGMVQARRSPATQEFVAAAARHGLTYVEPGMPAERRWDVVPAGQDVLVAGLGANFFDVVALLTAGRGGCFEPVDGPFHLRYHPSGNEPRLLAGSRRGLPYRGKSHYGALPPPYEPVLATADWFDAVGQVPDEDFRSAVWPRIAQELVLAHLLTLAQHRPQVLAIADRVTLIDRVAATPVAGLDDLVASVVEDPADRLRIDRLDRPDVVRPGPEEWSSWVRRWRRQELASVTDPFASPRAAVNRAMAVLRRHVAALVDAGAVEGASVVRDVHGFFDPLGLVLASGPPPERTAQLLALVEAGVVRLLGEGTRVTVADGRFVGTSEVRGTRHETRAFIETRMSQGHVDVTDDPLLRALLDSGRARLHTRTAADGRPVPTRTVDVTADRFALVDAGGRADDQVVVLGIPAGDVQPGSAIGATPGLPSPLLAGADRVAADVLARRRAGDRLAAPTR